MPWTAPAIEPAPDPALTEHYAVCLPGGRLAGPLLAFRVLPSTQLVARTLAACGAPEGTIVLAEHQTAGRGRRGRVWIDAEGKSLLVSCVLRPPLPTAEWPLLTLVAGCAVAEAIARQTGLDPRLRWPNDLLVGDGKVSGILTEAVLGTQPFAILGIGVNVSQREEEWPVDLRPVARSLATVGGPVQRQALLAVILEELDVWYRRWLDEGFALVRSAWRRRGISTPSPASPDGDGVVIDLAASGALLVRRSDGTLAELVAWQDAGGAPAPGMEQEGP
jgi:BirA family biotin operon repressor/biotin-[acetyl-CoA-carboxylase] ligase